MNTQPDQAAALEDKPRGYTVLECKNCKDNFPQPVGRVDEMCLHCRHQMEQLAWQYKRGRLK